MTTWTKRTNGNVVSIVRWTVETRPTGSALFTGATGFNTDFNSFESYTSESKWLIECGNWTTATRPATASLAKGSKGFNTDAGMGMEVWDGTQWALL